MDRLANYSNVQKLIGVDINSESVSNANSKYGDANHAFYALDCEDTKFLTDMKCIMDSHSIEKFDVITISMVLLHLKNPYKTLNSLRSLLKEGGRLMIRDIDDGLNFAYPDVDNAFQRIFDICNYCETSGFRHSGRQIYSLLEKIGMKNICLEKQGLNTISMTHDEREALFTTYFSFIPGDAKIMVERYPDNSDICADYEWLISVYDNLEERFNDHDFIFQLGFMTYTAEK